MQKGSILMLGYTGRVVLSNRVFETTDEKKAIKGGLFEKNRVYGPAAVVVGSGELFKALEDALLDMRVGETKKVKLKPSDAFGERKPDAVAVVPLQQFRQRKMQPVPGLVVELNGRRGKVQSVSGGRVRVDFNHPLAGKEIEYELRIEKELKDAKEQALALYKKYFELVPTLERKFKIGKDSVEVSLTPRWSANIGPIKQRFSELITKNVKGIKTVRFVEEYLEEKEAKKLEEKVKKEVGKRK